MITEQEVQNLIHTLTILKEKYNLSKTTADKHKLNLHKNLLIKQLEYQIDMKIGKYKKYNNYEDIKQEALLRVARAIETYDQNKGSFFWWFHRYVDTTISRIANQHSAIRFPMKFAKDNLPIRTSIKKIDKNVKGFELLFESLHDNRLPDFRLEYNEFSVTFNKIFAKLPRHQQDVINLAFGFDSGKAMSIDKISNKLNITKSTCLRTIKSALSTMKENIKI